MSIQPKPFESSKTFATYLASDDELFIFRRFKKLNARSLLYLQSELLKLEKELEEFDQEDADDGSIDVQLSAKCWEVFSERIEDHPREALRAETIRKVQDTLYRYNQMLLQQHDLMRLRQPESRPYKALKEWFDTAQPFCGIGANLLSNAKNFVALKPGEERDTLTRWMEGMIGWFLVNAKSSNVKDGPRYFSDDVVRKLATFVGVVGAVILLQGAIVALYFEEDNRFRFVITTSFTLLFAIVVGIFSNARRAEMFGACAAYMAVLVVFLSGNIRTQ